MYFDQDPQIPPLARSPLQANLVHSLPEMAVTRPMRHSPEGHPGLSFALWYRLRDELMSIGMLAGRIGNPGDAGGAPEPADELIARSRRLARLAGRAHLVREGCDEMIQDLYVIRLDLETRAVLHGESDAAARLRACADGVDAAIAGVRSRIAALSS